MPLGPCRPAIDAPGADARSYCFLPASSKSSRFGKGRRKPELGSMSDGIMLGMVRGESACVKGARGPSKTAAAHTKKVAAESRRDRPVPIANSLGGFPLSERNAPRILECGPGPQRIPAVNAVV